LSNRQKYLAKLYPLTAMEKAFRYLHEKGLKFTDRNSTPDAILHILEEDEYSASQYWNFYNLKSDNILLEKSFFQDNEDIFINIHPRYMPEYSHQHHFFELQYILSGSLTQTIGESTVELHNGDVCFIAPETCHAPRVFDKQTLMVNILIRKDTFQSTFMNLIKKNNVISDFFKRTLYESTFHSFLLCHTGDNELLFETVLNMIQISNEKKKYTDRLLCVMLEQFFIYLLRDHEYDFTLGQPDIKNDENIIAILRYIQQNFRKVTLTDTAKKFGYNESYMSRMIKKYTGNLFSKTLKTIKLQYAANMLISSKMPIEYIVKDSGYNDKSSFYRSFKEHFGITPLAYRNSSENKIQTISVLDASTSRNTCL